MKSLKRAFKKKYFITVLFAIAILFAGGIIYFYLTRAATTPYCTVTASTSEVEKGSVVNFTATAHNITESTTISEKHADYSHKISERETFWGDVSSLSHPTYNTWTFTHNPSQIGYTTTYNYHFYFRPFGVPIGYGYGCEVPVNLKTTSRLAVSINPTGAASPVIDGIANTPNKEYITTAGSQAFTYGYNINPHYVFTGWTSNITGRDCNIKSGTFNKEEQTNLICTANFYLIQYNVSATVNPASSGTVTGTLGKVTEGDPATLVATPNAGYEFSFWGGSCSGTNPTAVISSVTSDRNCVANFKQCTNCTPIGGGTGGGTGSGGGTGTGGGTGSGGGTQTGGGTSGGGTNTIIKYIPGAGSVIAAIQGTVDKQAPSVPTDINGLYNEEEISIELSWTASTDNVGVTGYKIERTEKDKDDWKEISKSEVNSYTDFEFAPSKTYSYRVKAFDAADNNSEFSSVIDVTSGEFKPNITAKDGGAISSENGSCSITFEPSSFSEDVYVLAQNIQKTDLSLSKNRKAISSVCQIRVKNKAGDEITALLKPAKLSLRYNTKAKLIKKDTISVTSLSEDESLGYLTTDLEGDTANAELDYLGGYFFVSAQKVSLAWLWWTLILVPMAAIVAFILFMYRRKQAEVQTHQAVEDYIYKGVEPESESVTDAISNGDEIPGDSTASNQPQPKDSNEPPDIPVG